jgi:hypothetical protein
MYQLTQDKPVLEPIALAFVEATAKPLSRTRRLRRFLKHPHLMHYNCLIALVMAANLVALMYGLTHGEWCSSQGSALKAIVLVAQANFAFAIIIRQPYVINLLHWLAT